MNEPLVALPGFTIPGTPNEDERILALPDGTIVWDVVVVEDKNTLPALEIWLSTEFGGEKIKRLLIDPKQISLINREDDLGRRVVRATITARCFGPVACSAGCGCHCGCHGCGCGCHCGCPNNCCCHLISGSDGIQIEPGTYRLRALLSGLQVAEKWVTIQPTPQNAAWLGVNKLQDCPLVLKPDTTP